MTILAGNSQERLTSTDEKGSRVYLYPADVEGFWTRRREWVQAALVIFFIVLPWLKFGGQQIVLLDLPGRKFTFFGTTFWAHEAPDLLFLLLAFVVGIAFVTAVFGRLWCGWACPQTVFIDGAFRKIERWVEGRPTARKKLDEAPWSWQKARLKALKWFLFFLVSSIISHSFLAYFVGAPQITLMIFEGPSQHWTTFLLASAFTAIFLFDFGWFRDQFCVIMCPYGRFQSLLMDDQSLAILYDEKRGEPRRGDASKSAPQGDCIDCGRCVQVCPTGIDIRRGVQMECIACTACIDACDEIMVKVHKPLGLIRYASESEMRGKPIRFLRRRTLFYLAVLAVLFGGFFLLLSRRQPVQAAVIRAVETPYQVVNNAAGLPEVINHFKISVKNESNHAVQVSLEMDPASIAEQAHLIAPELSFSLASQDYRRVDFFVHLPQSKLSLGKGHATILWHAAGPDHVEISGREEVTIVGPY